MQVQKGGGADPRPLSYPVIDLIISQRCIEHLLYMDDYCMPKRGHEFPEDPRGLSKKSLLPMFPSPTPTQAGFPFSKERGNIPDQSHLALR